MIDSFERLLEHVGHQIECNTYCDNKGVVNVAIECEDCYEVLLDFDRGETIYSPHIEVFEDTIKIYDQPGGQEIAGWTESDWLEDPSIIPSIFNAIVIAYRDGVDELKEIIKNDKED